MSLAPSSDKESVEVDRLKVTDGEVGWCKRDVYIQGREEGLGIIIPMSVLSAL